MVGRLTISIEIELGWGVHDRSTTDHLSSDGSAEREYLGRLLQKAEETNIPISFDIVGHLLLEECNGTHEGPYKDGWFESDPGSDASTRPLMYAPDMAREVLDAETNHELCTHTFSHILCGEVSEEVVGAELEHVQDLHADLHAPVSSFIPPRHSRPANRTLRRHGIDVARYAREKHSPTPLHRLKELVVGPHPGWQPEVNDGVLETYCTTYPSLTAGTLPAGQRPPLVGFRAIPAEARIRTHKYYLERATKRAIKLDETVHLWCHLYDLSNKDQWRIIEWYLEFLNDIPDSELSIETMEDLSEEFHSRK